MEQKTVVFQDFFIRTGGEGRRGGEKSNWKHNDFLAFKATVQKQNQDPRERGQTDWTTTWGTKDAELTTVCRTHPTCHPPSKFALEGANVSAIKGSGVQFHAKRG